MRRGSKVALACGLAVALFANVANAACTGDCGNRGKVGTDDLVTIVLISLDQLDKDLCPEADRGNDGVGIDDVVASVDNSLTGCPTPTPGTPVPTATATTVAVPMTGTPSVPTATATTVAVPVTGTPSVPTATATTVAVPVTGTPVPPTATGTPTNTSAPPLATNTPTVTPTLGCPLAEGRYTVSQGMGGTLKVDGAAPFAFPSGGFIIQEVGPASQPTCLHSVVVPFPGGFSAPVFCSVEAFGFSTRVDQQGCGAGYIDSNGGSDFTVTELGDTNAPNPPCNFPAAACMAGLNNNIRVDLTLGNGSADICGGSGTANAFVGIPVHQMTWQDIDGGCPDLDGQFDPGTDTIILDVTQILDFTTDTSSADWSDLDPNGCCINGSGPGATAPCNTAPPGLMATGGCMDIGAGTVTTAGTGTIGSAGAPLYDITFSTTLPNTITGPVANTGATCPEFVIPPASGGTITRCIQ